MPNRFFIYPLLVITLAQLAPLLRDEKRWYRAQIIQRLLILMAASIAMADNASVLWIVVAWMMFCWFVGLPQLALRQAMNELAAGEIGRAAITWQRVAMVTRGQPGGVYRKIATVLEMWNRGQEEAAESQLWQMADDPSLPESAQGEVRLCHLWLLSSSRQWERAVAFYESGGSWGTLAFALQARLAVARAYAELGQITAAIQCLVMVSLSTRTVGGMARQLWMTRVSVAALAGDKDELERLLADKEHPRRRGLAGYIAAWRGRCARQRGEREEAGQQLTRALALLPAGPSTSRARLTGYLENMDVPVTVPDESVRAGFAMLRGAEKQMAPWRNLMNWSRPASVTGGLIVLLCAIELWNAAWVHPHWHDDLSLWAGNLPWRDINGQWWRPLTAVFLHGGWLHLALNSVALWMFGTAIEKSLGWVRMLVIFVVAGTLANVASAYVGGFDVSVGASGGINGLIAAFGVTVYRLKAPIHPSLRKRLMTVLGLMIAADIVIGSLEPMIDNTAHIAGLMVGFLLALVP